MRSLRVSSVATAAILIAAGCGGSSPRGGGGTGAAAGETIKIGSIHPLTGSNAGDGQQMEKAVKLAIDDVNARGGIKSLKGSKLAVDTGDSQGKPDVGQTEASRLIQAGDAALIGTYQTAVTTNVAAAAERSSVPLLIDVAVADAILAQGYKYSFRLQPDATGMGVNGARYLKSIADAGGQPVKTVAYLHEQTDFGTSVFAAFKSEAAKSGITIATELSYDAAKASDLTTELTKVKAAKPDVLVVTGYYKDSLLIARNFAAVKPEVKAVYGVADGAFDLQQFPTDAGPLANNYLSANYHYDATSDATKKVREAFKAKYGEEMRTPAVLSYECVLVIADALERAKSADRTKLRDAIAKTSLKSLMAFNGPIQFDEKGQNTNAIPIVMQVQGGAIKQVFPQKFTEGKPAYPAVPGQ